MMSEPNQDSCILILFMGKQHEHAITSIQRFTPDAVHIITSEKFEKSYKRRLNVWSKKYDFRIGKIPLLNEKKQCDFEIWKITLLECEKT